AAAESNPLLQAIDVLERRFMLALNRGQAHAAAAAASDRECWRHLRRARTQEAALMAAVSNLEDHADSLRRQFEALWNAVGEQSGRHEAMLAGFEGDVAALGRVPLHPAL
ncbi:unnamed protein product, partial [Phaeothamnion confervicola]